MTTRRSRLKAVANLAVRRKPLVSQGSTNEGTPSENLSPEKVLASNAEKNIAVEKFQNDESEKIITDNTSIVESGKNESALCVNSDFSNSRPEKFFLSTEFSNSVVEGNSANKKCNLNDDRTGCYSDLISISNKQLKSKEKCQLQDLEEYQENQVLENLNFNAQGEDGKIVKEGSKSYAVLTPKNTIDYSLSVAPIINSSTLTNLNHVYAPEEFEVQFYTEIYSENIYSSNHSNDINGDVDCESIVEPDIIEPVLKNLYSCNIEKEINNENVNNYNEPAYTELRNVPNNAFGKSALKSAVYNRSYSSGSDKFYRSSASRIKDTNLTSSPMNLSTQNLFPDLQNVSQFRRKRSKYNDFTKKVADAKREFQRKYEKTKPDRSTLKMIDLIFYNPVTNPMESKTKLEKKELAAPQTELIHTLLAEEGIDDPEGMNCDSESQGCDKNDIQSGNNLPVPQVKIGVNGEIILDEKSLVIETTDAKKGRENLQNALPIFEDKGSKISYYGGKSKKSKDWADFETKRFYKALNTIGPDFTLMQKYFPKRSRLELKNKFKREERLNKNLIDKALNNPSEFDMTQLEKDLDVERKAEEQIEMRLCSLPKQTLKKPKTKSSFLSREMIDSVPEPKENQSIEDNLNLKIISENEKSKKKKEFDFVFQKLLAKESEKPLDGFPELST